MKMHTTGCSEEESDKMANRLYCDDSGAFIPPEQQRVMFD
jgi:hypothetical protein